MNQKLLKSFHKANIKFYRYWADCELGLFDDYEDLCESYEWKCFHFCKKHNLNYQEFKKEASEIGNNIISLFISHPKMFSNKY